MREVKEILGSLWFKYGGDWQKFYKAIQLKEHPTDEECELFNKEGLDFMTITEETFPASLKEVFQPPIVLFYEGDISLLNGSKKILGVICSETYTESTKSATENIVSGLPKEILLALPIVGRVPQRIIEMAISHGFKIIGVVPHDIRSNGPIYSKIRKQVIESGGLLISEYAKNEIPIDANKHSRRVLSGLSDAILCLDSQGIRLEEITIMFALQSGKEVGCLPHEPKTSRNNLYVKEGATLVEDVDDVLLLLNMAHKEE